MCVCVCELFACTHVMGRVADCIHVRLCMWMWFPGGLCRCEAVCADECACVCKSMCVCALGVGVSAHWGARVCVHLCMCESPDC